MELKAGDFAIQHGNVSYLESKFVRVVDIKPAEKYSSELRVVHIHKGTIAEKRSQMSDFTRITQQEYITEKCYKKGALNEKTT